MKQWYTYTFQFICCVFFVVTPFLLKGQNYTPPIQNGPRLSISYASFPEILSQPLQGSNGIDTLQFTTPESGLQYGIGMFIQYNLQEYLFFRPEFIIQLQNQKIDTRAILTGNGEIHTNTYYKLDIPLLLGYKVDKISVQGGIAFHKSLRNSLAKEDSDTSFKYENDKSFTTYIVGLGYQGERFFADAYFEQSLGDISDSISAGGGVADFKYNMQAFTLRIGFALGGY